MKKNPLPSLVAFDGEARTGKGTVVKGTADYLQSTCGYTTMLIDAGQVFRTLAVAAKRAGVDTNDASQIDAFLLDETRAEECVQFVKQVHRLPEAEREALIYTNTVGAMSAQVGARPDSQSFKDKLLCKWLRDAREEGYQVVLLDGRALEETGAMLVQRGLCHLALGLYFVCDSRVGAMRTLGFADHDYENLDDTSRQAVDQLVVQIADRNRSDRERAVQPLVRPDAPVVQLPDVIAGDETEYIIDTSATMPKSAMVAPVAHYAAQVLAATIAK